ncbi:MAG TPA: hypothetical protein PKA05_07025 [Roseiflexaceae bacterium]|nr:hypothetical protein [Roseiflexaceae bacterium]
MAEPADGRYHFSPLGIDTPLFNLMSADMSIELLATEADVPGILRRRPLAVELEQRRHALAGGSSARELAEAAIFFGLQPVLAVQIDERPIPPAEIQICDLSDWRLPAATRRYIDTAGDPVDLPIAVAVDPLLGRLALPAGSAPARMQVDFGYGMIDDIGGGPYDRSDLLPAWIPDHTPITWQLGVSRDPVTHIAAPDPTQLRSTLTEALEAWHLHVADPANAAARGLIVVMDSASYAEALTGVAAIRVPPGSRLAIVAGDWPLEADPTLAGALRRRVGAFLPGARRPHLRGDIEVQASAPLADEDRGELTIDGLLIEGRLTVIAGDLGVLRLAHCTLVPSAGGITIEAGAAPAERHQQLQIHMLRCISGSIGFTGDSMALRIAESIIDGVIATPAATCDIQASTIFGLLTARSLDASNSVFSEPLQIERRQIGCLRFCFIAEGSRTGRRYRCQPELALTHRAAALGLDPVATLPPAERHAIIQRVQPSFTTRRYGQPAYGQLSHVCPPEITAGAEDGAEMGFMFSVKQTLREANLRMVLEEYLRAGMDAGMFYIT